MRVLERCCHKQARAQKEESKRTASGRDLSEAREGPFEFKTEAARAHRKTPTVETYVLEFFVISRWILLLTTMSSAKKQIYYSDKYSDEEYEYR